MLERPFCTRPLALCCLLTAALAGCAARTMDDPPGSAAAAPAAAAKASVSRVPFGTAPDGAIIELFTMTNASGMEVRAINYGGAVTSIKVPDRNGRLDDVVLGYDTLDEYLNDDSVFGALVGRYANRIALARFTLDGKTYTLNANSNGNTLHGGFKGFNKAVWHAEPFEKPGAAGIVLTHTSPDGDEGFPGTLSVRVTYTLTDANELSFDYRATTDKPTVVNFTHHGYFNLAGHGAGDVLDHRLLINADRYTPVDATLIPLGELASVAGTPLDFRELTPIGARIDAEHPQMRRGAGYDHNFVINRRSEGMVLAARVEEPVSGRVMEVRTTEPGIQLYTADHLRGRAGKGGRRYDRRGAFCLETQHFPDSPNHPAFPTTTLRPGQEFHSRTVYAFGTL